MVITILGVAIGVAVFLSIQLANRQTLRSFEESVNLVLGRADAIVHAEGMAFDEKYFKELSRVRKLVKSYPVIEGYGVELKTGQVVEILGTDLLQDSGIRDFSIKTLEKDLKGLLPIIMDPKGIVLPEKFIPGTNFKPGDKINFLINGIEKTFNVNAILENKGLARALNGNFALMDIAAAQWAFGRIGKLDRIDIEFKRKENFESIREKISEVLPILPKAHCAAAISMSAKFPLRARAKPLFSRMAFTLNVFSIPLIRKLILSPGLKFVPGMNFSGNTIPFGSIIIGNNPLRSFSSVLIEKSLIPLSCRRSVPRISTTWPVFNSTPYPSITG
jgi:putative ABC transport system permease protein